MVANKPSIYIYVNSLNSTYLKEICAGIEEEGVLYTVINSEDTDVSSLAYEAANSSMLGSGIGISQSEVAMQMKGLKKNEEVFKLINPDKESCRAIGANSARAIKKLPLKV